MSASFIDCSIFGAVITSHSQLRVFKYFPQTDSRALVILDTSSPSVGGDLSRLNSIKLRRTPKGVLKILKDAVNSRLQYI